MRKTDTEHSPRTPWLERGVFLLIISALGLWVAYTQLVGVPHTVLVDGKALATLDSRREASSVLDEVRDRQLDGKQIAASAFAQRVSLRKASGSAEIDSRGNAVSALDQALVLKAQGYAILVDDKAVIALAKEDDAFRALDLLKQKYAQRLKQLYSRPAFKEQVTIDRLYLPVESIMVDPEKAAEYLTVAHDKPVHHTIKPGDRAVRITAHYGISLDDLKSLNPRMDTDRLTEGDRLLVSRPKPPVTVITKALETKIAPVRTPAVRGIPAKTGKRQTWMVVTYENGRVVDQLATRVMTTWDKPAKPAYAGKRTYRNYSGQSGQRRSTSGVRKPAAPAQTAPAQTPPKDTPPAPPASPQ